MSFRSPLILGCIALATPASAQTVVALNGGAASVAFPRGEPQRVNPPDKTSVASTVAAVDGRLETAGHGEEQAFWNAYFEAQLTAVIWTVDDVGTGQVFMASGYRVPAADKFGQLTCKRWLETNRQPQWVISRKCQDLRVDEGQVIELQMTFKSGVRQIDREYAVRGQRYSLSHSDWGDRIATLSGVRYAHADDSASFFASFKLLGDKAPSTPPH